MVRRRASRICRIPRAFLPQADDDESDDRQHGQHASDTHGLQRSGALLAR
jgi:hypothetical protein